MQKIGKVMYFCFSCCDLYMITEYDNKLVHMAVTLSTFSYIFLSFRQLIDIKTMQIGRGYMTYIHLGEKNTVPLGGK